MELLGVVAVAVVIWWLSAKLHPYIPCETCKGAGKHTGTMAKNSARPCHACSGRGIKQRPAARLFRIGSEQKSTSRLQPRTRDIKS